MNMHRRFDRHLKNLQLFVATQRSNDSFPDRPPFVERVLDTVSRIPRGKVMSYGDIAEYLGEGGPRQVAKVMSTYGSEVPWHRVLRANGSCAERVSDRQLVLLRKEPVVFDESGRRVRMDQSRWDGQVGTRPGTSQRRRGR